MWRSSKNILWPTTAKTLLSFANIVRIMYLQSLLFCPHYTATQTTSGKKENVYISKTLTNVMKWSEVEIL